MGKRPLTKNRALILLLLLASVLISLAISLPLPLIQAQTAHCELPFQSVGLPLNDLGSGMYGRNGVSFPGGLYPNSSNSRPASHNAAGVVLAQQIEPLDAAGNPANDGKIALITVGMSNTFIEFNAFEALAATDSEINPKLVLVNGSFAGQTSEYWVDPDADPWQWQLNRLAQRNVTPQQVQVAWVKQTRTGGGNFPDRAQIVQADLEAIARNLKLHYPNLKIAYFSSRTRSYTHDNGLSPEPVAFENGFAVKWLIAKQIEGDATLNYNPDIAPVVAPYLSWGPYLWIDGLNARSDGLTWEPADMVGDCTHPSAQGADKVAQQLMDFFKTDETAVAWFLVPLIPAEHLVYLPLLVGLPTPPG
jgi:hypothetical protein